MEGYFFSFWIHIGLLVWGRLTIISYVRLGEILVRRRSGGLAFFVDDSFLYLA